jgi:hypothetical protein
MVDQRQRAQLIDALQQLRALAIEVGNGAYRRKERQAVDLELTRRWSAAMKIKHAIEDSHREFHDSTTIEGLRAFQASGGVGATINRIDRDLVVSGAMLDISSQKFSVESIDEAIRVAARW